MRAKREEWATRAVIGRMLPVGMRLPTRSALVVPGQHRDHRIRSQHSCTIMRNGLPVHCPKLPNYCLSSRKGIGVQPANVPSEASGEPFEKDSYRQAPRCPSRWPWPGSSPRREAAGHTASTWRLRLAAASAATWRRWRAAWKGNPFNLTSSAACGSIGPE